MKTISSLLPVILPLTGMLFCTAGCLVPGATSGELNRPAGQYPGNPAEDFAPIIRRSSGNEYRNLAHLRPAYHSSSYDYNLTAQLVTDGIISTEKPWYISVIKPDGEASKQEREYLLDGMPWSAVKSGDKSVSIQIDLHNYSFCADEVRLQGRITLPIGKAAHQQVKVSTSADGEHWEEVSKDGMKFIGADSGRDKSGVTQARYIDLRCPLSSHKDIQHLRFELSADIARYWEVTQVQFYHDGEEVSMMPSEHFCSTWRSAGSEEEWVYVDLGDSFTFDHVKLNWINRASRASLQISDDARSWKDLYELGASGQAEDKIDVKGKGRYVRLLCHESQNGEPYELSEMQVFGHGGFELVGKTHWRLERASEVSATGQEIASASFDDSSWLPATVPGTVLTSYLRAGSLPDPNYRDNQLMISDSYFNSDFWYRTRLHVDETEAECTFLNFDGINWKAEIYLNGQYVDRIEGAFKQSHFDVTDIINKGENYLAVRIIKNAHPGRVKEQNAFTAESNGGHLGGDNATFHASIGWDWLPTVRGRNNGIWNDVYLTHTGAVTIEQPFVDTHLPLLPDTTVADVTAQMMLCNHTDHAVKGMLRGAFGDITFSREVDLLPHEQRKISFGPEDTPVLHIDHPHLWWPNGYGEPYLYEVKLAFEVDERISHELKMKSGIRQMTWSDDKYEAANVPSGSFGTSDTRLSLYVNGRRFIGMGGNWGLSEHNLAYRGREFDAAVRYHRDMNFTMIRNWVGQIGDEEFYEACDRYGIMIWQDFWLANPYDGPDPYYEDLFMDNATDLVRRIRNHPSVAIYVGRNEGYPPVSLDKALQTLVKTEHPSLHYISHSAAGVVSGGGPYRALPAQDYFGLFGIDRFHSERGMPCIPNYESMELFMDPADMLPLNTAEHPNAMYGIHDYCLNSAQRTQTFNEMLDKAFGIPADAKQFADLSQWICYNGYRAIFESRSQHRRGLLLWMSHPSWPSFVWQTYDYYFDPTAAYFACKKACEPLHIQWNALTESIEVVNTRAGMQSELTAHAELITQVGEVKWQQETSLNIGEDQTVYCFTLPSDEATLSSLSPTYFVRLSLKDSQGRLRSENTYWRGIEDGNYKSLLSIPQADLDVQTQCQQVNDEWLIKACVTNKSNVPAMMVRLTASSSRSHQRILPVLYSDNYFFLMPGEKKEILVSMKTADCHGEKPEVRCVMH